ncbi:MAG: GNAT family N-acetyltransferase [Asgard group archaeon]|nr:GNAT family N-acetyltransferase [Asgard group archaeon]
MYKVIIPFLTIVSDIKNDRLSRFLHWYINYHSRVIVEMFSLDLQFRELTLNDLGNIKKLSNSMGMLNDPKIGNTAEALIKDSKCLLYGAFLAEKLVGVGGLREKTKELAWIEDIRVHGNYQKKGIGLALFNYGEQLAREQNYPKVGYQTVTENKGSCRIGEKLGFTRGHEMVAFVIKRNKAKKLFADSPVLTETPIETALELISKIPNGPKDEINIGWSYVPLTVDYFKQDTRMKFFFEENTMLLEFRDTSITTGEIDGVKAMVYGSKNNIPKLVKGFLKRSFNLNVWMCVLCPHELTDELLKLGFKHTHVWTGNHNVVVLFTKNL